MTHAYDVVRIIEERFAVEIVGEDEPTDADIKNCIEDPHSVRVVREAITKRAQPGPES